MRKVFAGLLALTLTLCLGATALAAEPIDLAGLMDTARRGLSREQIIEEMGAPDLDTEANLIYDDPMNGVRTQFDFEDNGLVGMNIVVTYGQESVDVMYIHFLYYEAGFMELLGTAPSFASYVDYTDLSIVMDRFDGGMYGWYDVNGGDVYVGATFDSGVPLLYISCSGLLDQ